jgi:hypothetical protein
MRIIGGRVADGVVVGRAVRVGFGVGDRVGVGLSVGAEVTDGVGVFMISVGGTGVGGIGEGGVRNSSITLQPVSHPKLTIRKNARRIYFRIIVLSSHFVIKTLSYRIYGVPGSIKSLQLKLDSSGLILAF